MNIDDVKDETVVIPPDIFEAIFEKQLGLMHKYEPIEKRNGAVVPEPVGDSEGAYPVFSIDDPKVQMRLKDMFWRATEELAEAFETRSITIRELSGWKQSQPDDVRHTYEELIDAIHFLVEASIIAGVKHTEVTALYRKRRDGQRLITESTRHEVLAFRIIRELGLAANTLKNKPWKQSHMATDQPRFMSHLGLAWDAFFNLFEEAKLTEQDIYLLYFKKNAVNQFRQRSNY